MDKKNTLLLTVIAVATLLVAVVGATFAYFSVVSGNTTSKTTVTGQTPKVGTITMITTNDNLYLNVTAEQMAKDNVTKKFYATTGQYSPALESETLQNLATITVAGGEASTKYYCKATLTAKFGTSDEENSIKAALKKGDLYFKFDSQDLDDIALDGEQDVKEKMVDEEGYSKEVTFTITGNGTSTVGYFTGNVYLENRSTGEMPENDNGVQNYLADKKINIEMKVENLTCDTAAIE